MPLIEIENVSKLYGFGDATTVALDNVSLRVEKGEFVAIMGPSGSGKSTLMNIIGLLDTPTHGTYKLSGQSVETLRSNARARIRREKLGFIFQSFNLLSRLNVIENVGLPLVYRGVKHTEMLKQASKLLKRLGLSDREYYMPNQLSGGQIQRVAVSRALINKPELILADEPTGNLDTVSSKNIMELLSEIHKEGNTIIMVTHNPDLARYANRTIQVVDGRIVSDKSGKKRSKKSAARKSSRSKK